MTGVTQRQLPLNITLRDEATLDNFFKTDTVKPLLNALQRQLGEGGEAFLYCYGAHDAGKTHLLQGACHLAGESGSAAPRELAVELPDLQSRLSWGEVYQLQSAGDDTKQEILRFRAQRLGLEMPIEVGKYIVSRAPRALSSLLSLLRDLDTASLAHKRPLTVPFVKAQLGW